MSSVLMIGVLALVSCCYVRVVADATFEQFNPDASDQAGKAAIATLKTNTRTTVQQLLRYSDELSREFGRKLDHLQKQETLKIDRIADPALNDVKRMIASASMDGNIGKDYCYEQAETRIRDATQNGFIELDSCGQAATVAFGSVQNNVQVVVRRSKSLFNELDAIFINCYTNGDMENCIAKKLPHSIASVKGLRETGDVLRTTGHWISSNALGAAYRCHLNALEKVRQTETSMRLDALKCLDVLYRREL